MTYEHLGQYYQRVFDNMGLNPKTYETSLKQEYMKEFQKGLIKGTKPIYISETNKYYVVDKR